MHTSQHTKLRPPESRIDGRVGTGSPSDGDGGRYMEFSEESSEYTSAGLPLSAVQSIAPEHRLSFPEQGKAAPGGQREAGVMTFTA